MRPGLALPALLILAPASSSQSELTKLTASDKAKLDHFGSHVAISGGLAIVAAFGDDEHGSFAGATYVFRFGTETVYCGATQNPNNAAGISISTLNAGAPSIILDLDDGPPGELGYLLVGDGTGVVQPPGSDGDLCIVGGSCLGRFQRDVFVIDSAGNGSTDVRTSISSPCIGVTIVPGTTWNWQFWHSQPMGQPSTFSAALATTFY